MTSIFIRTYHKDIKWLSYCLKSIHKNLKGWDEIVVTIPNGQEHLLSHLTQEKVIAVKGYEKDYIGQQITKLQAHLYCKGNYILYVDSDVVFYEGANVEDYFFENKPIILYDYWENVGDAIIWKEVLDKFWGFEVDREFMRCAPQLFKKDTLVDFNKSFQYEDFAFNLGKFSEFNLLGSYAYFNKNNEYSFHEGRMANFPNKSKQYWSYSGLTQQERIELERI